MKNCSQVQIDILSTADRHAAMGHAKWYANSANYLRQAVSVQIFTERYTLQLQNCKQKNVFRHYNTYVCIGKVRSIFC